MRAFLSLTCGGPGRVAVSAAFAVTCAFLLAGNGGDLVRAAWYAFLWLGAFALAFGTLAFVAAATGVADGTPTPAPKEADNG
ncbi:MULTISPECIES: hypothetical protein [unclassified Methylobacterium]|jgi:hypothetical protein|uniref:hypothetical protein n=1 Tax=unclassified Methylobacterium TaxID=2615210 RepID=UPI0005B8C36F|nr:MULTISPECIES: hypothetical protein [unclassified Methylobacterium]SFV12790.1 hypothetical protein SAMN02799643_05776 [Methylobacterium sp. UNCCL125]